MMIGTRQRQKGQSCWYFYSAKAHNSYSFETFCFKAFSEKEQ